MYNRGISRWTFWLVPGFRLLNCHCKSDPLPNNAQLSGLIYLLIIYADLRMTFPNKIRITDLRNSTDYDIIISHSQATRYVAEFILQIGFPRHFRHVEIKPELLQEGGETNEPG